MNLSVKNNVDRSITQLLVDRLQKRKDQKLHSSTCSEIYQDIFFTISEIVKEAQTPLSNESVNLLAQMYYESVNVQTSSGPMELDPNIFTQRAKLENIPTKELALLATMMNGTPYGDIFINAGKRR